MPRPTVTIITPTYNHERYLEQCVQSVLAQEYQNWEQIIVDDGSTDGTAQVAKGFRDARIRYVRQENVGILRLAETYNRALAMAQGDFIAILEGDDFWPPWALRHLVAPMEDPGVVLSYGRAALTQPNGLPTKGTIPSSTQEKRLGNALQNDPVGSATLAMASFWGRTFTFPCALLLRRSSLHAIGGFQCVPGLPFIDLPTLLRVSTLGRFAFVPMTTGYWRIHGASATRNRKEIEVMALLRNHVLEFLEREGPRLGIQPHQIAAAQASWNLAPAVLAFDHGRSQLMLGQWSEARASFRAAWHGPSSLRMRAAAGWLASLLHIDLERLAQMLHRQQRFLETHKRRGPS